MTVRRKNAKREGRARSSYSSKRRVSSLRLCFLYSRNFMMGFTEMNFLSASLVRLYSN